MMNTNLIHFLMNYQTVLQNYHPTEQGDFMLKYEIDGRGYVIYSPEKDSWSCIELHSFSELTPWQLAFVLSLDMRQMKEQDEFSFSVCCKREKLLSYLSAQARQAGSPAFTIPFDRQQLADYLGVERSAMSAELGKLRREGILECRRSSFLLRQTSEEM